MFDSKQIFSIQSEEDFQNVALEVFRYQAQENKVYNNFLNFLNVDYSTVKHTNEIPFLPIQFFKKYNLISGNRAVEKVFTSSGTTGMSTSKHLVTDLALYHYNLEKCFEQFYGPLSDYTIFALLPSYLERTGSSLIDMVEYWIEKSGSDKSGFYLYNHDELYENLIAHEKTGKKAILIGVSFALLDFVENYKMKLKHTIVMETGGMKGRKKEITREELHTILKDGFGTNEIHSEYGMTELLSQGYSRGDLTFKSPNWMRIMIRETEDPLSYVEQGKTGGVNVIDLANYNSISFIATDDLGKKVATNQFEILGRFDHSDVRGCNLMVIES
ncbi:acyl transferase [Empedobacter falsenii]|uniref:Acyl transferase n=1 Tax=Empedobacter falsenii TaxID=343874 RepID=A0ABY8V617_9FLAO|nr:MULTISPECIES: acyl transferase [Empedobacter]MDM1522925.1 acyl transferase [Empedobacter sp. 225-1]MDM1542907.1 acyl transferase [Empedobacter sp. 189-2]WIH97115.1 acyl transferase [Empedobacter falsenii]